MFKQSIDSISKIIASMKLNRFLEDLEYRIGKMLVYDTIIMEASVDIVNGDTVIRGKNSIVDQGLIGMINFLSSSIIYGYGGGCNGTGYGYFASANWSGSPPPYYTYMLVGSDTSYGTTHDMVALKSPIGAPTKPNSQSGSTSSPSTGVFQVQWTATWNPGTVSGTLGEAGLYLYIQPTLASFQANISPTTYLFSRMASADGKFTAFTINTSVPLSIAWAFRVTYAT